jgi:GNAT superfamily N-acetyltransferase
VSDVTLGWTKEDAPRWDADKQRLFTTEALAAVGMEAPQAGYAIADEWWRVTNDGGDVVGYGWLDTEWGNAQIALLVGDGHRGRGIGDFILRRLEEEARARGLNYIYNVVPDGHPNRAWMTQWLLLHGFLASPHGDLRRQVSIGAPAS